MKVRGRRARPLLVVCWLVVAPCGVMAEPQRTGVMDEVTISVTAVIPQATVQCSLLILDEPDIDGKPGRDVVGVRLVLPASMTELPLNTTSITLGGKAAEPLNSPSSIPAGQLMLFGRGDVQRAGAGQSPVIFEAEIGAGHRIVATEGTNEPASLTWAAVVPAAEVAPGSSTAAPLPSRARTAAVSPVDGRARLSAARRARLAQRTAGR